ncbi:polyprenol phosphomannose-dependent alpha 1,6 mannosyltransferase MptB [Rothia sp. CCM 9419]|uniref:polyprenol phosphomannose-dependent alpha 1,6 mannosyltransferase MptB n=1 Tax=Rothia sp. CCM 9419 TaxID=3402662 RepID=UPI003AE90B81
MNQTAEKPSLTPTQHRNNLQKLYVYGNPLRTIIMGTIGSILMTIGSFGVGWISDASPLNREPLIIALRYNVAGIVTCILLLAIGGMMMCREWLRLSQKLRGWGGNTNRWTWSAIICWTTPQLFAFPLFSRDVFSYFAQGRVMLAGLNPYENGVSTINNFFQYGADPLWAQSPPPYGTLFLWIEELVVRIAGSNIDLGIILFRLIAVFGVGLIAYYVPKTAFLQGFNSTRALWLVVANPLFIAQFVTAAHNDALMTGIALAGFYYATKDRNYRGGIIGATLVTLAIAIKPIALVLLPFIGLLWAGKDASWIRIFTTWFYVGAISLAELTVMGLLSGFGFGWIGALSTTGGQYIWYSPMGFLMVVVSSIVAFFSSSEAADFVKDLIGSISKYIGMGSAVIVMFRGASNNVVRRAGISLGLVVVFSPMIQSWYLLWVIPFFAITGIKTNWQLDFYFITTLFFMIYAVSDQLDVSPYLKDFDTNMGRLLAVIVSFGYACYLVFVDPATRRVLRKRCQPVSYQLVT